MTNLPIDDALIEAGARKTGKLWGSTVSMWRLKDIRAGHKYLIGKSTMDELKEAVKK